MARARNIKPGFFRNADLVELSFEARLLFIGLWTLADREGRLEDRPKQIKMEIFPADNVDCDSIIGQLADIGVVARYEHGGKRYLQVVNFCKHQNPHRDEKASTIPDQYGNIAEPKQAQEKHCANTVQAQCNNSDETVQERCGEDAGTVAIGLIPDSLIPDSINLIPDPIQKQPQRAPRFDAQAHLVSIGVDATIAADWLQHRKSAKAAPTLTAINGIATEAGRAGISLSDALAICCQRGWRGFKAEWLRNGDQEHGARNAQPARPTIHDERAYTAAALTGKIPARTTFEEFMAAKIPVASAGMKLIEGEVVHAA